MKHRSIAWPTELLHADPQKRCCVGFVMPRIEMKMFQKALLYLDPSERIRFNWNWKYPVLSARNLASAVAAIHSKKYCIGDLNESNVLVGQNALIALIDCDSFQVMDTCSGKTYRCPVGKPEYTAPELMGKSYTEVDRTPETDCFALAVLIFQLMMEGTLPYQAKGKLVEDAASTEAKIIKGLFPYTAKSRDISPPDHAPPFEILPLEIRQLFDRCFSKGHRDPAVRPTAVEWFDALQHLGNKFKDCPTNKNHIFLDHLSHCPWCQIAAQKGRDPYPYLLGLGGQIALADPTIGLATLSEKMDYLRPYLTMALADGILTVEEKNYLLSLGSQLQIPTKDLQKIIEEEVTKTKAKIASSSSGTAQLELSKRTFEFLNLSKGSTPSGSVTISNIGGGSLAGTITARPAWLSSSQARIDTARHRQELGFVVDTSNLAFGSNNVGTIEVQSNGGNAAIEVRVSIEVPDAALGRYRHSLVWISLFVGGMLGLALYTALPHRLGASTAEVAGLGALLAFTVWGAVKGRVGGFFGALIGGVIVLAILEYFPSVLSVIGWSTLYGLGASLAARQLFVLEQKNAGSAIKTSVIAGIVLAVGTTIVGVSASSSSVGTMGVSTSTIKEHPSAPTAQPKAGMPWTGEEDKSNIKEWVKDFLRVSEGPRAIDLQPFFDETVSPYYKLPTARWALIREDKENYFRRFPTIHYTLVGKPAEKTLPGARQVEFEMQYSNLRQDGKTLQGRKYVSLDLRLVDGRWKVAGIREKAAQ
jgi:serine/threonine protein kinase